HIGAETQRLHQCMISPFPVPETAGERTSNQDVFKQYKGVGGKLSFDQWMRQTALAQASLTGELRQDVLRKLAGQPTTAESKQKRIEFAEKSPLAAQFIAGFGDVIGTAASAMQWLGQDKLAESFRELSQPLKETVLPPEMPDLSWKSGTDPAFWAAMPEFLVRNTPFTLSLIPAMIVGYTGGTALASAIGLSALWTTVLGAVGATLLSRPVEGLLEAGGAYDEAVSRGMTPEQADQVAQEVFFKNLTLSGWDIGQLATAFLPTPARILASPFIRTAVVAGKVVVVGLTEAGEEELQEAFQKQALGDPVVIDQDMKLAMILGLTMGSGMGGAGGAFTIIADRTIQRIPPSMKPEFFSDITEGIESGLTEEQAIVVALDEFAKTPEGQEIIQDVVQQVQKEDAELQIEASKQRQAEVPKAPPMTRQERELIESDLFDLKRKLQTAPVEEQAAIQRRIDILKSDLERGEALIGVVPEAVPEVALPEVVPEATPTNWEGALKEADQTMVELETGQLRPDLTVDTQEYQDFIDGEVTRIANKYGVPETILRKQTLWETSPPAVEVRTPLTETQIDELVASVSVIPRPPAVEAVKPPPPVAPIEVTPTTIIEEGGAPISPEELVPSGVVSNVPILQDVGLKEKGRPARKVFERLGLYELFRGIQRAEVEIGEARTKSAKEFNELRKSVPNKDRWGLIVDEIEDPGSVPGLTFQEKRVVNFWRNWADAWADKKNLPQSKRIKNYFTHLFEQEARNQMDEFKKLPPELGALLDTKVQKKITDPFLKERFGAVGWIKDPFKAMEAYEAVSQRILYYEPFLQRIAEIANTPATHPATQRYLKDYSRRMTGEMSKFDQDANVTMAEFGKFLEKIPAARKFSKYFTEGNPAGMASYNLTGVLYTLWLGFKATSAIRNLSQHTLIIGEVGPENFGKGIALRFTREGQDAVNNHSLVWRSRKSAFVPGIDDSFVEGGQINSEK
ncbi:hypothetical protein LCGC14_1637500, partial [marine sediment metagenome]